MKVIDGQKYSQTSFDDYYYRVKLTVVTVDDKESNIDIYTTETNRGVVERVLDESFNDKVRSFNCVHWATKEQDDIASKFIDETLKDWN